LIYRVYPTNRKKKETKERERKKRVEALAEEFMILHGSVVITLASEKLQRRYSMRFFTRSIKLCQISTLG
jgi:predicted nucleic acid-binding protein